MIRSRRAIGAVAVAAVAVLGIGTQNVLAGGGDDDAATLQGAPEMTETWNINDAGPAAIPAGAKNIEFVSLSTGCRIFDTRASGGPISSGGSRDFSIRDASIPGQGGKAAGCGIPTHAVAVDLSISTPANSATNTGYVRLGPGGATPTATVLQFLKNQGNSVTTTTPVSGSGAMRAAVFAASTNLVGDVLGYWQRTLHATVSSAGSLVRGNGVTSITHSLTGFYVVRFEREILDCTPVVSPAVGVSDVGGVDARAQAVINGSTDPGNREVFIHVHEYDTATTVNKQIQLTMEC